MGCHKQLAIPIGCAFRNEQGDAMPRGGAISAYPFKSRRSVSELRKNEVWRVIEKIEPRPLLCHPSLKASADPQFQMLESLSLDVKDGLLGHDLAFVRSNDLVPDAFFRR